jgi:hypothetical protein
MSESETEGWFRNFLLLVSAFILLGTIVELILVEHTEELLQWVPFILSGLGIMFILVFRLNPSPLKIYILRSVMTVLAVGCLYGIYLHFIGNFEFSAEIHPNYTFAENFAAALMGASPMMAPGILFLAALLAVAGTYRHPLLKDKRN